MAYRVRPCATSTSSWPRSGRSALLRLAADRGGRGALLEDPPVRADRRLDDGRIVAGAGAYPLELTLPAGPVPCAGVTVVGVLPSSAPRPSPPDDGVAAAGRPRARRARRGALGLRGDDLRPLRLRARLARAARRGEADAGPHPAGAAARGLPADRPRRGDARAPPLRPVRKRTPGFVSRSRDWWEARRLGDRPENRRGAGPLVRALYGLRREAAGYALYRIAQDGATFAEWRKTVRVVEVMGVDEAARGTCGASSSRSTGPTSSGPSSLPSTSRCPGRRQAQRARPARLRRSLGACRRRAAALAASAVAKDGRATIRVTADPQFPENVGTWTSRDGRRREALVAAAGRAARRAGPRIDAARRVHVLGARPRRPGGGGRPRRAPARADELFRAERAPWCPEIF